MNDTNTQTLTVYAVDPQRRIAAIKFVRCISAMRGDSPNVGLRVAKDAVDACSRGEGVIRFHGIPKNAMGLIRCAASNCSVTIDPPAETTAVWI